ncbi:MAG: hypothetical protein IJ215_03730 [Clostridia bacterium]|nr:hypothetical protein [Clostridia bacterium]
MKRISLVGIVALVLCFAMSMTAFASDDTYREKVPRIVFEEFEKVPEVAAGETLNLTITYTNDSAHNAYNMRITPSFEDTPLVYERPVVFKRDKSLRARQSDNVSFSFKVADNAKSGIYGIKFKLEYSNVRDENYSNEQTVYFKVAKEKVKPILSISDISTGASPVMANKSFPLSFQLSNNGEVDAENVEIYLRDLSSSTFMAQDSNDYKYIGELKHGSSIAVNFNMFASESITKGTHTLGVEIKYKDYSGSELSTEKIIYVQDVKSEKEVEEDNDETAAKPKIIISSYATNPRTITAGGVFDFNFTFKNTSRDKRLRNMKVTLDSAEGAFIITNGSNTFYIEELLQNASVTKSIELRAKQDLTSNSYAVTLSFDYEDYSGNEYHSTETINIPVTEYSKLVINNIYINEGYVDSNSSLSFDYINMGKATVSNLTASVEGDYVSVQPINYIGNLTAGNSDYYDIEVTPTKEGTNYGILVLSFEDSSGGIIEVKKDFEGFAMIKPDFSDIPSDSGMYDPGVSEPIEPAETPVAVWKIILAGIGSFLLAFFVTKMITTKIIRRKLEDEI